MASESDEVEVAEEAAPGRSKKSLVVVGLITLGILLVLASVGGVYFFMRAGGLEKELIAVKKELVAVKKDLKEKLVAQGALVEQLGSLTKQLDSLKEASARSVEDSPKQDRCEVAVPASEAKPATPRQGQKPNPSATTVPAPQGPPEPTIPPKMKRPQPEGVGCELVGKSAEEQAATLKRCVGVMDSPKGSAGSK